MGARGHILDSAYWGSFEKSRSYKLSMRRSGPRGGGDAVVALQLAAEPRELFFLNSDARISRAHRR